MTIDCLMLASGNAGKRLTEGISKAFDKERSCSLKIDLCHSLRHAQELNLVFGNLLRGYRLLWVNNFTEFDPAELARMASEAKIFVPDFTVVLSFTEPVDFYRKAVAQWLEKFPGTCTISVSPDSPSFCDFLLHLIRNLPQNEKGDGSGIGVDPGFAFIPKNRFEQDLKAARTDEKIAVWNRFLKTLRHHLEFERESYARYLRVPDFEKALETLGNDLEHYLEPFFARFAHFSSEREKHSNFKLLPFGDFQGLVKFLGRFYSLGVENGRFRFKSRTDFGSRILVLASLFRLFELVRFARLMIKNDDFSFRTKEFYRLDPENNCRTIAVLIGEIIKFALAPPFSSRPEKILSSSTFNEDSLVRLFRSGRDFLRTENNGVEKIHQVFMNLFFRKKIKIVHNRKTKEELEFRYDFNEFRLLRYEYIQHWLAGLGDQPEKVKIYLRKFKKDMDSFERILAEPKSELKFLASMEESDFENMSFEINENLPPEAKCKVQFVYAPKSVFGRVFQSIKVFAGIYEGEVREVDPGSWFTVLQEMDARVPSGGGWRRPKIHSTSNRDLAELRPKHLERFGEKIPRRGRNYSRIVLFMGDRPVENFKERFLAFFEDFDFIDLYSDEEAAKSEFSRIDLVLHYRSDFFDRELRWKTSGLLRGSGRMNVEVEFDEPIFAELYREEIDKLQRAIQAFEGSTLYGRFLFEQNLAILRSELGRIRNFPTDETGGRQLNEGLRLYGILFYYLLMERMSFHQGRNKEMVRTLLNSNSILVCCDFGEEIGRVFRQAGLNIATIDLVTSDEMRAGIEKLDGEDPVREFLLRYDYYFISDWQKADANSIVVEIGRRLEDHFDVLRVNLFDFFDEEGFFLERAKYVLSLHVSLENVDFDKRKFSKFVASHLNGLEEKRKEEGLKELRAEMEKKVWSFVGSPTEEHIYAEGVTEYLLNRSMLILLCHLE